jgi:hypothetical protein
MRARKALPPLPTERNRMLVPTNDGKAQSILSKVEPNEEYVNDPPPFPVMSLN